VNVVATMFGGLNTRTVVLSLVVAGLVTGGNLWLHMGDTPLGYTEYSRYGFSLLHPSNWNTYEGGFTDPGMGASDFQGMFQAVLLTEDHVELMQVGWQTSVEAPEGALSVEEVVQSIESTPNTTVTSVGPFKTFNKEGFEVTYTVFGVVQRGQTLTAVVGFLAQPWPSLRGYRVYVFSYAADSASTSQARAEDRFHEFIDGFRSPE
jgi:hypothetical protein